MGLVKVFLVLKEVWGSAVRRQFVTWALRLHTFFNRVQKKSCHWYVTLDDCWPKVRDYIVLVNFLFLLRKSRKVMVGRHSSDRLQRGGRQQGYTYSDHYLFEVRRLFSDFNFWGRHFLNGEGYLLSFRCFQFNPRCSALPRQASRTLYARKGSELDWVRMGLT